MEDIPNEVFETILTYLINDGVSLGRLSLCSNVLYQRINRQSPHLWKSLIEYRWTVPPLHGSNNVVSSSNGSRNSSNNSGNEVEEAEECLDDDDDDDEYDDSDYCLEYIRRHEIDQKAEQLLLEMKLDLMDIFQLSSIVNNNANNNNNDITTIIDHSSHVGRAWDHPSWKQLLAYRSEVMDLLRSKCQLEGLQHDDDVDDHDVDDSILKSTIPIEERLMAFLAARCLQNVHFAECLHMWKDIDRLDNNNDDDDDNENNNDGLLLRRDDPHRNSILMEQYALLICRIQQSPPELIEMNKKRNGNGSNGSGGGGSGVDISTGICKRLDEIASTCLERINNNNNNNTDSSISSSSSVDTRIRIVNDVLVNHYGFGGNEDDYYNYRNSLLHHILETKKAIPITLCILYTCICRRVDIPVNLIGLPGHVVLGFTNDAGQLAFLDVFRKGKLLNVDDCIAICTSYRYPWHSHYLIPLPASAVLQRILNNLNNCHFQAMAGNVPFHSELFFQQRALDTIHRQPSDIAGPLVDRVSREIPLTLSPDLMRYYGLLSRSRAPMRRGERVAAAAGDDDDDDDDDDYDGGGVD